MGERITVEQIDKELVIESIPQPILTELALPPHWCRDVWNDATLKEQVCKVLESLLAIDFKSLKLSVLLQISIELPNGPTITSINPLKDGRILTFTTQLEGITMETTYHYTPDGVLKRLTKLIKVNNPDHPPDSYSIDNIPEYLHHLESV